MSRIILVAAAGAVLFIIVVVVPFQLGVYTARVDNLREDAVDYGCAQYDPQTGAWGWSPVTREGE